MGSRTHFSRNMMHKRICCNYRNVNASFPLGNHLSNLTKQAKRNLLYIHTIYCSNPTQIKIRLFKRNVHETPNVVDARGVVNARCGYGAFVDIKAGESVPGISLIAPTPAKPAKHEERTTHAMIDVASSQRFYSGITQAILGGDV